MLQNQRHDFTQVSRGVAQDLLFNLAEHYQNLQKRQCWKMAHETRNDATRVGARRTFKWGTGNLLLANMDSGQMPALLFGEGRNSNLRHQNVVGGVLPTADGLQTLVTRYATQLRLQIGFAVPYNAVIKNIYGNLQTAPAAGTTCTFTVRSSSSCTGAYTATALTCTVTGDGSNRNCSNNTNEVNISAGDCLQIHYNETGTCSGIINWGFEIGPQ